MAEGISKGLGIANMKILFIGGTGVISHACSQLCLEKGFELYLLNRGTSIRPVPEGCRVFRNDINDVEVVREHLARQSFDVVVDWIAYTPDQIQRDFKLFVEATAQYIFISSAAVYQRPPERLPITEDMPLHNSIWKYAQEKINCEKELMNLYEKNRFPVTIIRPSHTYDQTKIPLYGGTAVLERMRNGQPIIIHGDGTSLWPLTHHHDFAKGFVGLLGKRETIGQAFHITSDETLTWNAIYHHLAEAMGIPANILHIPSDFINRCDSEWGDGLLGDKSHSMIFDNTKIKSLVPEFRAEIPFRQGAKEIVDWYLADPVRMQVDLAMMNRMDKIVRRYLIAFQDNG